MKGFNSLLTLLVGVCLSLLPSAASATSDAYNLLGFSEVEYEVAINPCVDEAVLLERFGATALQIQARELSKWPKGLCQNLETSRQLYTWNYYYTTLLANTERPAVLADEISKHLKSLKACTNVACLNRLLPRMIEWVYLNIDRLPVYTDSESARRSYVALAGEPVVHPTLALRNLPSTLSGLSEVCKGESTSDLDFFTVNFSIENHPLVLAMCKNPATASSKRRSIWLLERTELVTNPATTLSVESSNTSIGAWREILVERGDSRLYVLTNSRTTYPTLYSRRSTDSGEVVVTYDFEASRHQYLRSVVLNVEYDALGRAHAFIVPN